MDAAYRNAIGSVESSNNYAALGPETDSGDRAYGRYQVMGNNIPEWTQRHLGKPMTPQEFLADRDAQDKVFDAETSAHFKKYGNLDDVTSTWFSGRPMSKAGNDSDDYNTVPQYIGKVNAAMDGPTAIDRAMGRSTGSKAMAFNATDDEGQPALRPQAPMGALTAGGSPVAPTSWLDNLGQTLMNMAPGIAQDPDNKRALVAAAAQSQKVAAGTGTWSTNYDPRTGIATQTNSLNPTQTRQFKYAGPKPEKPEKDKAEEAYDTATGKAYAEKNQSIQDASNASRGALGNLSTLRDALSNPEVYQGTGGASVAAAKKLGNSLFGMDFKGVADADVAAALANKLTQESRQLNGGMPGSLSDRDLQFLRDANPGLDKTPEANNRIIDIYEKLHNRNIEINKERIAYTKGGTHLDDGFQRQLEAKWAAQHAPDNAAFKAEKSAATTIPANTFKTPSGVQWRRN